MRLLIRISNRFLRNDWPSPLPQSTQESFYELTDKKGKDFCWQECGIKHLIYMVFCCNGYMLRKQIRKLFHLLSDRSEKDIEFDIAELILTGFLLQKTINKDTRTQMLYLSKYPKSQFLNKNSRDVAAINWSEQKIFEQIFRIDYIIEKVIPDMRKQDFEISMDNIIAYLNWNGSNLLLSNNQVDMVIFYNHLWNVLAENDHNLTDDFSGI